MLTKPCELHPASYKHLRLGHPWVIKDNFTQKFPKVPLLYAEQGQDLYVLLHDPDHPKIKARLWGRETERQKNFSFWPQVKNRLKIAIEKRNSLKDRAHCLVNAEADQLPGLTLVSYDELLYIRLHAFFWQNNKNALLNVLRELKLPFEKIWWDARPLNKKEKLERLKYPSLSSDEDNEIQITHEGKIRFILRPDDGNDIGHYPDMASIREDLQKNNFFKKGESFLNLFSYTGLFSLFALEKKMSVLNVDLSSNYMNWFEQNRSENQFIRSENLIQPVSKAIMTLIKSDKKFDKIISDPPTSSSDGKKRINSLQFYRQEIKQLETLLNPGGEIILFINTHQISRSKFKKEILSIIQNTTLKFQKEYGPSHDFPVIAGFPEGDYLKGIHLKKNQRRT